MDPIAPVARAAGDNAERANAASNNNTRSSAGLLSSRPKPDSRTQQQAAAAGVAVANPLRQTPPATATTAGDGNDQVTREVPPQLPLVIQNQQTMRTAQQQQQQQMQHSRHHARAPLLAQMQRQHNPYAAFVPPQGYAPRPSQQQLQQEQQRRHLALARTTATMHDTRARAPAASIPAPTAHPSRRAAQQATRQVPSVPVAATRATVAASASGPRAAPHSAQVPARTPGAATVPPPAIGTPAAPASAQQHLHCTQQQQPQDPQVLDEKTLYEEQIAGQRSVLVDKYAPFIAPSDTSLKDARQRLHAALDQTRKLRCAFTERVYGKYRVCLKPAESSEETIRNIKANPVAVSRRLEEEIRQIKEEKELEKKESLSLNAEINKMDASMLAVSAENADQLMYLSAGLSLVILPEEVVDPKLLAGYQDRGPVNPATGQRVRSISQAAAAAGEVILDRSRKGAAMRKQWQQQRKLPPDTKAKISSTSVTSRANDPKQQQYSPLDLLTTPINPSATKAKPPVTTTIQNATGGVVRAPIVPAALVAQPPKPRPIVAPAPAVIKVAAQQQPKMTIQTSNIVPPQQSQETAKPVKRPGKTPTIINTVQASSAKFGRSRGGAGISVNISLSLNPTADELSLDPEKSCRASTAALLARGAGTAQGISRASPQQRLRHPFPASSGGRQRASSATSAKKELATLTQHSSALGNSFQSRGPYVHSYLNLALPPLPTPMERRDRTALAVIDESRAASNARAKRAIRSVLENFKDDAANSDVGNPVPQVTKIGLLHGIQKSRSADANKMAGEASPAQRPIDPTLAFSVLQAIGLVTDAGKQGNNSPSPSQMDAKLASIKTSSKRKLSTLAALESKWSQISLSKKARFSETVIHGRKTPKARGTAAAAPLESIRGGGELLSETNDETTATGVQSESDSRKPNTHAGSAAFGNRGENHLQPNNQQQARWEDPSRSSLSIMNSHLGTNAASVGAGHAHAAVAAPVAPRHQGQPSVANNEAYHHPGGFNALHLAHQLRHAGNAITGPSGDMQVANFMGGLHHPVHWSPNGTPAAAMAAAQSSLAAMGLSFPMGVYNAVQDRAARALLARDQQNVAAAHAVAAHQQSISQSAFLGGAANPGFAPTSSSLYRANPRGPLLNSVSQAYATGAPSSVVTPSHSAALPSQAQLRNARQSASAAGNANANEQGNVALLAKQPDDSRPIAQPRVSAPPSRSKRKAGDIIVGNSKAVASTIPGSSNDGAAAPKKRKEDPGIMSTNNTLVEKARVAEATKVAASQPDPPAALPVKNGATLSGGAKKGGMQLFVPPAPALLTPEQAKLVQTGQVHALLDPETSSPPNLSAIMEYVVAVGANVPIPKAFVSSSLKERLNIPGFKNLATSAGFSIPREIIVAVIVVWLWNYHEEDFQRAFAKSGRIDVDPTCKWLVQAAIDASVRALTVYITESGMIAAPRASKCVPAAKTSSSERPPESTPNVELVSASVVGKALTTISCKSREVDCVLPEFHELTQFLDECRTCALHSRSQERVLLANLISLKSVMSESFAHAYVSSMVRAGDALDHDNLAEIVVDEDLKITSLLPYDILKDESGAWEDPCRPEQGFTPNLTGDVLTKVAHARAMIQKSLRRLQDRHNIKAGTPTSGAYADLANGQSNMSHGGAGSNSGNKTPTSSGGNTPKSWSRRKLSSVLEGPAPSGTGSAQATSWALYDPRHYSAPLAWNSEAAQNAPYGRHRGHRPRSLSTSVAAGQNPTALKPKKSETLSIDTGSSANSASTFTRSTNELDWSAVAGSFHHVKLKGGTSPHASATTAAPVKPSFKTIISPFCRELTESPVASDDESDTEEDLRDEAVLGRHQVVLDAMKEKLTAFMESRKKKN